MKTSEMPAGNSEGTATAAVIDTKLEVVLIPVSDVDRSKEFYASSGGGSMTSASTMAFPGPEFGPCGNLVKRQNRK